jgi:hypothetical protein
MQVGDFCTKVVESGGFPQFQHGFPQSFTSFPQNPKKDGEKRVSRTVLAYRGYQGQDLYPREIPR